MTTPMTRCPLIPTKTGFTVPNSVVQANREFDRQIRAGLICAACATPFSPAHPRDTKLIDCCARCAADFE